jgi:hypothetical protein
MRSAPFNIAVLSLSFTTLQSTGTFTCTILLKKSDIDHIMVNRQTRIFCNVLKGTR